VKISTFVLLVLIVVAFSFWKPGGFSLLDFNTPSTPPPAAPEVAPGSGASPTPRRTFWQKSELEIVHGYVDGITEEGVSVYCVPPEEISGRETRTSVTAAAKADLGKFGPVLIMEGGRWHEAEEIPDKRAAGKVFLFGHPDPIHPGSPINVVAAPLGNKTYTTQFQAPPKKPGSWMWNHRADSSL
jgi:hypothetical protein